jgi:serine/threonine protein kinase
MKIIEKGVYGDHMVTIIKNNNYIYRVRHSIKQNALHIITPVNFHADIVIDETNHLHIAHFDGKYINYPHIHLFPNVKQYTWSDFDNFKSFNNHPHIYHNEDVIVKTPLVSTLVSSLHHEIDVYTRLPYHENIAEFLGVVVNNNYVEGLVIKRYQCVDTIGHNNLKKLLSAVKHIAKHVGFHGDITPDNIVVTPDNTPKIIDLAQNGFSRDWAAPEILDRQHKPDFLSDVYSLGLVARKFGLSTDLDNPNRKKRKLLF